MPHNKQDGKLSKHYYVLTTNSGLIAKLKAAIIRCSSILFLLGSMCFKTICGESMCFVLIYRRCGQVHKLYGLELIAAYQSPS